MQNVVFLEVFQKHVVPHVGHIRILSVSVLLITFCKENVPSMFSQYLFLEQNSGGVYSSKLYFLGGGDVPL
jgi:hypothetical protein